MTDQTQRRLTAQAYRDRIDRVRLACQERGWDGLILADQASLYYLFGYDQIGYWVFQVVYLPADGQDPVAICRAPDELAIAETGLIDEVRVWFDDSDRSPGEMLADLLRDRGVGSASTVGIELATHALLPVHYEDVRQRLDWLELVDGSSVVADQRVVKDPTEIAHFRTAAEHLSSAFAAGGAAIAAGFRETDVHRAITSELYRLGGDPPAIAPPIASGPRTITQTHGAATDRLMRPGDTVTVEIGASVARYHAVGARSYAIGEPDPEVRHMHRAMVESLEAGFGAFEPGRPISDVSTRVHQALDERGLSRAGRHFGYGTGIGYPPTWLENLRIKATEPRSFVPGMTFFYFVGLTTVDRSDCVYIGEPVLITESGHERVARPEYDDWYR